MVRGFGIPEEKTLATHNKRKGRQRQQKQNGIELWEVKGTHSSLGLDMKYISHTRLLRTNIDAFENYYNLARNRVRVGLILVG